MFEENLDAFMRDFSVPVIWPAERRSAMAHLDQPDRDVSGGVITSREYSIEYPSYKFPNIGFDDILLIGISPGFTIDEWGMRLVYGGACELPESGLFRVKGTMSIEDGAFTMAQLERISS
jgi:hypothetical protein